MVKSKNKSTTSLNLMLNKCKTHSQLETQFALVEFREEFVACQISHWQKTHNQLKRTRPIIFKTVKDPRRLYAGKKERQT